MKIVAVLAALVMVGCAAQVAPLEPCPVADASAPDAGADALTEAEASPDAAPAEPDPCRCAFIWTNTTEVIHCYTRGDCAENVRCEAVQPMTEDSGCRFRAYVK